MILKRGLTKVAERDGIEYFRLNRDPMLRNHPSLHGLDSDLFIELFAQIECPFMIVKCDCNLNGRKELPPYYEIVLCKMERAGRFHYQVAENAGHHEHLNDPHKIFRIIKPFMQKYHAENEEIKSKL